MKARAAAPVQGDTAQGASTSAWPALAFTALVAVAAAYAFSPRPAPPFAPTAVHPDGLLVNGLARSGQRLVAVGEQGHILIADDARGPWREAAIDPQRGSALTQVKFIDDKLALAVGHDGWILRSEDGGEHWKEVFFIESPRDDTAASASADGALAPPPDAGPSAEPPPDAGTSAEPPPDTAGADAALPDASAAGWPDDDAGSGAPPLQPDPLLGIAGPFDGRIFAVGGFGLMLVSTDQGQTWQRVLSDALGDHHLNAMLRAADRSLIVVGERGLMARSTDEGQTWQALPSVYDGSFFGAMALPSKALLAFGMRGHVFRSEDDGRSWHASKNPSAASLFGGNVSPEGEVVLVGAGNTLLISDDDGRSFTQPLPVEPHDLAAVLPLTKTSWLVAGDGGIRLARADGKDEGEQP